jgi:hypothetical protein
MLFEGYNAVVADAICGHPYAGTARWRTPLKKFCPTVASSPARARHTAVIRELRQNCSLGVDVAASLIAGAWPDVRHKRIQFHTSREMPRETLLGPIKTSITIWRYSCAWSLSPAAPNRLARSSVASIGGMVPTDHPMRRARAILEDLVLHVQPPKGCAIVLTERPCCKSSDPNWVATVGPMGPDYAKRYTAKVAELRKTDLRIDWAEIASADKPRRIALRHSELIGEPV